jgi:hypothetical protein
MNDTVLSDRRGLLFLVNLLLPIGIFTRLEFPANLTPAHTFFGKIKACSAAYIVARKGMILNLLMMTLILPFVITNLNLYFKKHPELLGMIMTMVSLASLEAFSKNRVLASLTSGY